VLERVGELAAVLVGVHLDALADLAQVAGALHPPARVARPRDRGDQDSDQQQDDAEDDEQFD
jgi:hypothetical protein